MVTDPGIPECHDAISFASIGTGKHHADSQFMLAGHTRFEDYRKTLLLTYIAKKRAEVSPTVGSATDLFFMGTGNDGRGFFGDISPEIQGEFAGIHLSLEEHIRWVTQQAFHDAGAFVDQEISKRSQAQALPESTEIIPAPEPEEDPHTKVARKSAAKKKPRK